MKYTYILVFALIASALLLSCQKKTYCYVCLTTTTMKASDGREDAVSEEAVDRCDILPAEKVAIEKSGTRTSAVTAGEVVLTTTVTTVCTRKNN